MFCDIVAIVYARQQTVDCQYWQSLDLAYCYITARPLVNGDAAIST